MLTMVATQFLLLSLIGQNKTACPGGQTQHCHAEELSAWLTAAQTEENVARIITFIRCYCKAKHSNKNQIEDC